MSAPTKKPCTGADIGDRGALRLPILEEHGPRGAIRRSRSGRRRAVVLATIQLLMIAHVILWLLSREYGWFGGRTTTPIEPSESMEFVKHGVINAGLIFFAVALLATLVLGRWFCGWGCHLVMLQDLCGWIMRKCRVRPRAFRSRLLIYVPLLLALYMFAWPLVYRFGVAPIIQPDLQWPGVTVHVTTTEFWKTFPGVLMAIPFLAVCGFATVYFLGAKGFCTYGCPYGGFFAPLDKLAPGRIRVTDACEHCGHCTAVCTSNVRVHEEVREYGMVVDPGCMKCLDCVSVCPNDALYYGFGRPAVRKGAARHEAPPRRYDLTWPEEIAFAAVLAGVFFAVRGVYGVPMLMAAGVAGVVTFLAWKLWRLARDPNVRLHAFQLKRDGRLGRAGTIYAAATALVLVLCLHSGVVQAAEGIGWLHYRAVASAPRQPGGLAPEARSRAEQAQRWLVVASGIADGGVALASNPRIDYRRAWLHAATGEYGRAEALLRRAIDGLGESEPMARDMSRVLRAQGRTADVVDHAAGVISGHPDWTHLLDEVMRWCVATGNHARAQELARRLLAERPDDARTLFWQAVVLAELGRYDEARQAAQRAAALDTADPVVAERIAALLGALPD